MDVLYKSEAYAALYKSYGETVDAVKADDITVSILRETRPRELFKYLENGGGRISSCHRGIYYIEGAVAWFPTQIVVIRELDKEAHTWLRGLSSGLDKGDLWSLLEHAGQMAEKFDKEMAGSVLGVSIEANRQAVQELIGDERMFETLMEIMEPKIIEAMGPKMEEAREAGLREGRILGTMETLRNIGHKDAEIKRTIMKQYGLTEEEADGYLHF